MPVKEKGVPKVGLTGGNHRLAVARAKGVDTLPIIYHKKDLEQLKPLFSELSKPSEADE